MSSDLQRRTERLHRFERFTEIPLLVLAVVMVPLLLTPEVVHLSERTERVLFALDWMIWGVFAAELSFRVYLAPRKLSYVGRHWFDVLSVALPFLRPLRMIRSAQALRLLRFARVLAYFLRATDASHAIMARRGVPDLLLLGLVAFIVSAVTVTFAERGSGSSIDGFDTAAWWALTTVTTVGYGDTYPVTAIGRGIATFLMLVGIGLFSLLTANVAAHFVESETSDESGGVAATLDEVVIELRRLHERLDAAGIPNGRQ